MSLAVAPTDTLLVARVERIDGVPVLVVVSTAALATGRVATVASPGLAGVRTTGRYVFYRVSTPVAWVAATVTTSGGPATGALVTGTGLPFAGLTTGLGQSRVPGAPGAQTLTARVPRTALVGSGPWGTAAGLYSGRAEVARV